MDYSAMLHMHMQRTVSLPPKQTSSPVAPTVQQSLRMCLPLIPAQTPVERPAKKQSLSFRLPAQALLILFHHQAPSLAMGAAQEISRKAYHDAKPYDGRASTAILRQMGTYDSKTLAVKDFLQGNNIGVKDTLAKIAPEQHNQVIHSPSVQVGSNTNASSTNTLELTESEILRLAELEKAYRANTPVEHEPALSTDGSEEGENERPPSPPTTRPKGPAGMFARAIRDNTQALAAPMTATLKDVAESAKKEEDILRAVAVWRAALW